MSASKRPIESPLTADKFLRTVLRSRLLSRDELQDALKSAPREIRESADAIADYLVRHGKLTRYQSGKLLQGISQGMALGPFRILAPLGRGGMGTVFLVRDTRTSQLVALKILMPRIARTETRMLARFKREMEMSKKVSHAHLAWTYEVGEVRGVHYIAMEYIPGRTLSQVVAEEGKLDWKRAARIMAEVASALHHAHEQGLIHRDMKPSNILITPRDHAKVLDLGLALVQGEQVEDVTVVGGQGYIVGTMDYIAPEQTFDAASVDRRCDIYSLGCTLYYALTGRAPFPGGTAKEKIAHHRRDLPPPLGALVTDLPPGFIALVERFMSKDPDRRPSTALLAEQELQHWADHLPEAVQDLPGEVIFDENAIILQSPGSSEYEQVSLPEIPTVWEELESDSEEKEEERREGLSTWILLALTVATILLFVLGCVLLAWLVRRV